MQPLLFIMAIIGCGESDAPCRELGVSEPVYASEAQCLAATEEALLALDDAAFPALVAECRAAGERPRLVRGSDVQLPQPTLEQRSPVYAAANVTFGRR